MGIEIGTLYIRRSILIRAAPERVWREFETFERFSRWFGTGHRLEKYEPRIGGTVDLSVELPDGRQHFGGPVLVFDPACELTYESQWAGNMAWPVPTFHTIRLTPLYDGTHVELFHHGFERMGADAANQLQDYESGWDVHHLVALRETIGG